MSQVADQAYVLVDDAVCADICDYLKTHPVLALDTETYHNGKASAPGLISRGIQFTDPYTNNIRLVQIRPRDDGAYLFDLKALSEQNVKRVAELLASSEVTWLGYNLKFDYKMIAVNLGVRLEKVYDLMLSTIAIGQATGDGAMDARGYSLRATTRDFLDLQLKKDEQKSNWGADTLTPSQLQYAANDLRDLFQLYDVLHKAIVEDFGMEGGVQLEQDVLPYVGDIELNGIGFDIPLYHRVRAAATAELPKLEEQLCVFLDLDMIVVPPLEAALTGRVVKPKPRSFNGAASNPLAAVQFVVKAFNKKGVPLVSGEADHVQELSAQFPILAVYARYKDLTKQLSTDYLQWINPQTGCIHPEFDQAGAATGRFSSRNPNLQNVSRLDLICLLTGEEINYRYCFTSPNTKLMPNFASTDYTGQEVSAMVVISQEPVLINILNQPKLVERDGEMVKNMANDVHAKTAELMFGKEFGVTCWTAKKMKHPTIGKPFRDVAKVIVFGLCVAEGTLVNTTRGPVPIEDIKLMDSVWTDRGVQLVETFQDNGHRKVLTLFFDNGQQLTVTPNHPVLVQANPRVWVDAGDLQPGAKVVTRPTYALGLSTSRITKVEHSGYARVYDIGVAEDHCFVANGVVVHNCYGKTSIGLAQDWNISEDEAEAIVKRFFDPYPVLKRELDKLGKFSAETSLSIYGYGSCIRMRMVKSSRHSDRGAAERAGKNTPIQGISALMMKRAIVEVGKRLRALEKVHGRLAIMVGTVHDELMTCFSDSIRDVALQAVADGMQAGGDFYLRNIVPAGSETAVAQTWTKG